ncbi:hypothetical protein [Photorhabdus khanii]|uniref:hypothetical protein n=1 Tax=Photorhabdus khanii TaxID=1004150 RepID=UPI00193DD468|nr:hypothetical protein [Photorhabdus khanii]
MMNKKFFDDRISFYKIHQIFFCYVREAFYFYYCQEILWQHLMIGICKDHKEGACTFTPEN